MQIPQRYTGVAITLHWVIAALIIVNLILSLITEQVPEHWIRTLIDTHKSIGITLLGLILMRVLWRISHPPPSLPPQYRPWERRSARVVHVLLYVLMLVLPITGWMHDSAWKAAPEIRMHWFGLFEWPRIPWIMRLEPEVKQVLHGLFGTMHYYSGYLLGILVCLHIGAALKPQFVDGHGELQRMWR